MAETTRAYAYENGRAWSYIYRKSYLVLQKRVLCSMPLEWQEKFFALLDEAEETLALPESSVSGYEVQAWSSFEDGDEEPTYCDDPLASYRHVGPLPLKKEASND